MNHNLYVLFENSFSEHLEKKCLEMASGDSFTYQHLHEKSAQYANLLNNMGISRGDRVAVHVEKSHECLFLYLGCLRAGIIYLPLNPDYKDNKLTYYFTDATPKLIVCSPKKVDKIKSIIEKAGYSVLETLDNMDDEALSEKAGYSVLETLDHMGNGTLSEKAALCEPIFNSVICDENDVAAILYTSGTTGDPKGVMLTHLNLATNGLALRDYWGFHQNDVLLHMLPIFHVHGLFFACHCALLSASKMFFLSKFTIEAALKYLPESTVMMGVPTFYIRLLDNNQFNQNVCKNMRLFTSGSAPLLEKTFHEFESRTKCALLERYGMTETGVNTSNPLQKKRIPGTVGFPLANSKLRIVDDHNKPVPPNETGNIQVKGKNVFKGYWNKPEKIAQEFTEDGFFKTGDQGRLNNEGYVSIVGRTKDMIITGGLNVSPKEIELCIDEIHGVHESAIIGLPHNDFGEAVTAIVVKNNNAVISESDIIKHLKEQLANYKVPKRVFFVESLPRNTMGKVQKKALRDQYESTYTNITTILSSNHEETNTVSVQLKL